MAIWWYFDIPKLKGCFCMVRSDEHGLISHVPKVLNRFRGQPIGNLKRWATDRMGGSWEKTDFDDPNILPLQD